jgi:hypothetical protein
MIEGAAGVFGTCEDSSEERYTETLGLPCDVPVHPAMESEHALLKFGA